MMVISLILKVGIKGKTYIVTKIVINNIVYVEMIK